MTSFRFLRFLLFLLFHQVCSEVSEPVFKAEGSVIEMGYCFGVDYIVVYRTGPNGDQLLGNSSASVPITPPADFQGRILINKYQQLLGLQIINLAHADSGIYRRECWRDQNAVNHYTHQLIVCNEEIESKEISVRQETTGVEVLCDSNSVGVEGTSVHWYYEAFPHYRPILFVDSSMSLKPLVEDLQGAVEVRDSGSLLLLNHSVLNNNQQLYCLVVKGGKCLSFQNMYMPDTSESRDVFASLGDRVVLPCTSDSNSQQWDTPLGLINDSSVSSNRMFISSDHKTLDYSLVIPAVDDGHDGEYSCISPSHETQYTLIICPKKEPKQKVGSEAGNVLLECDVGPEELVQWYRQETSDTYVQIYDSSDENVTIPEDLRGRLTLSHNRSSLTLSDLVRTDEGLYYCVGLRDTMEIPETDDDYDDEYDDEETEDDENSNGMYWDEVPRCVFKQVTLLSLMKDGRKGPVEVPPDPETSPTAGPKSDFNATGCALGIGLTLLVVIAVIAAVIVIKRKRGKTPPQQSEGEAQSGLNLSNDIKMNVEPSCTDSLAQNDEFTA